MITISSTGRRWLQFLPLVAVLLLACLPVPPTKRERPPPLVVPHVVAPVVALVVPPDVEENREWSRLITISGEEFVLSVRAASPGNDGFRVYHVRGDRRDPAKGESPGELDLYFPYGVPLWQRPVHPARQ